MLNDKRNVFQKLIANVATNLNVGSLPFYNAKGKKEAERYIKQKNDDFEADRYYAETLRQINSIKGQKPTVQATKSVVATPAPKAPTGSHWDFLESKILPITRKHNVPDALAASQFAVEGGRRTESPINNFFGIGPNIKYPSVERNVEDYALTVEKILNRKGSSLKKEKDARKILALLQQGTTRYEGHNPDPNTYINTVTNTPEWRKYYR